MALSVLQGFKKPLHVCFIAKKEHQLERDGCVITNIMKDSDPFQ